VLFASLFILKGLILSSSCLGILNRSFLKPVPAAVLEIGTKLLFFSGENIGSPFSIIDY